MLLLFRLFDANLFVKTNRAFRPPQAIFLKIFIAAGQWRAWIRGCEMVVEAGDRKGNSGVSIPPQWQWLDIDNAEGLIMVVGAPDSGKSTLV
jgi:hypothetical protein